MKAVVYREYGSPEVLQLVELEKPKPKDNEVLVKIYASTVTSGDTRLRSSDFPLLFWLPARLIFGLFKPKKKVLGHEFSGVVETVGKDVTSFNIGDHVFGTTTMLPSGSYAEYVCIPQEWKHGVIDHKPANLSFQEVAALPIGCMTAMFLLEKANFKEGQQILIYGASGSVGSFAVQLAKEKGLLVDGVCSTKNTSFVKSIGADHVIDYKSEDFTKLNKTYDIVFDAVGKITKHDSKRVLVSHGVFVSVKMLTVEKSEHLKAIKKLAEEKKLTSSIDKKYTLNQLVEAHRYVNTGRKKGNVVIEI